MSPYMYEFNINLRNLILRPVYTKPMARPIFQISPAKGPFSHM